MPSDSLSPRLDGLLTSLTLACAGLVLLRFSFMPRTATFSDLLEPALVTVSAAAAFQLLVSPFPALLARNRYGLPRALLAPIVHSLLMALIAALATTAPVGIQKAPEQLEPVLLWLEPRNLFFSALAQCLALVLLSQAAQRRPGSGTPDR